jgi:hypothetical protein
VSIENVWAQLELEQSWRREELRLLSNSRNALRVEADRDRFRRAQLVMLYAHVEGFCKVALLIYVKAVNNRNVKRLSVCDELVASSLDGLFHALEFGDKKGKVFRSPAPPDEKLLLVSRRRDFLREFDSMMGEPLSVPETAVSMEDNLNATVLRKSLFRLGFPIDLMKSYEDSLNELVKRRNNIAHGIDDANVRATDYDRLEKAVFHAMDLMVLAIIDALERETYLRPDRENASDVQFCVGEMR